MMIRLVILLVLAVASTSAWPQNGTEQYDYIWIQLDDQNYQHLVISTESEVSRVTYKDINDKDKGLSLAELTDKWFVIKAAARLKLIQEYERAGWKLFSMDLALAVMRKPRR